MAYIKFKNAPGIVQVTVLPACPNVVRITTEQEPTLDGFRLYLDEGGIYPLDNGEYANYTTLYRQGDGWYELSNDGSVYEEPVPTEPGELTEEEQAELKKQQQLSNIQSQITSLKTQIEATDYQIVKTYEYSLVGLEPEYDMEKLHQERQAIRDQINILEGQLQEIA